MADLLTTVRKLVEPILHRVKVLAQRGVVRSTDDSRKALEVQAAVLAGETLSRIERFAHFGFTSRPPVGAEVIVLCLGGNRDHPIAIADEDRRSRPVGLLAAGETVIYATGGALVHVKADGSVVVVAPGGASVQGDLEVSGDVLAGGDVADAVGTLAALRIAYNAHTHTDPQGGVTGPPVPTA